MQSHLEIDSQFATSCLGVSLDLLVKLLDMWKDLESATEIFHDASRFLPMVPRECMPQELSTKIRSAEDALKTSLTRTKSNAIFQEKIKPKILKLFEPEFSDE